jgi:Family of unknown function (DUF5681)
MSDEAKSSNDGDKNSGYGRPPESTQFKKGKSGNPKGRPKGSRNLTSAILAAANERVTIVEDGKRKTITKLEAATKQLVNKAASGNERAIVLFFNVMQVSEGRVPETPLGAITSEEDRAVMADLAKRFSRETDSVTAIVPDDAGNSANRSSAE